MIRNLTGAILAALLVLSLPVAADGVEDLLPSGVEEEAPSNERGIEVETDAAADADIRRRLRGIYAELEALEMTEVSVANGIVTLAGTVPSSQVAARARKIAGQVEGVVEVVDELTIDTDVGRRVESTVDRLQALVSAFVANLPVMLLAFFIVTSFWFAGRWFSGWRAIFRAVAPNTFIADLLSLVARVIITLAGVILALTLLDATSIIGSVLGAAGIVGLALGFAVRDTVENFIASILLSLRTPFIARDYVRIGEHEGTVARLTSRATILISLDGNHLRIPNALVYKAVIVNFTRQPERRFEFVVGVDTDLDLNAAQQTALDTLYGVSGVLVDPPAIVLVTELGDSNVSLTARAWIDQRESDVFKVRSEAIRLVKQAFDDEGITMPEPIYRVRLQNMLPNFGSNGAPGEQSTTATPTDERAPDQQDKVATAESENRTVCAQASDTSADDSVNRSIERELSDAESENLLDNGSRTE